MKYLKYLFVVIISIHLNTLKSQNKNLKDENPEISQIAIILFDDYETLDVFGPAEIFGRLTDRYQLTFYSQKGGIVSNRHGVPIMTTKLDELKKTPAITFIPGGLGTRIEVNNESLINHIKHLSLESDYVLSVCTGSALLAKTGLLDGRNATSNKRAFSWVTSQGVNVNWDHKARWAIDGKYYTSSGVSAGMDMAFGFLADRHGVDFARKVAWEIEYNWIEDKNFDKFTAKE